MTQEHNWHRRRGEHLLAQKLYEAAEEELREAASQASSAAELAVVENLRALAFLGRGQFDKAVQRAEAALAAVDGMAGRLPVVSALNRIIALAEAGRLKTAFDATEPLLTKAAQDGAGRSLLPNIWVTRANIALETGRLEEAAEALEKVLPSVPELDPQLLATWELAQAILHLERGRPLAALPLLEAARRRLRQHGSPRDVAHVESERARAFLALGDAGRAVSALTAAARGLIHHPAFVDRLEQARLSLLTAVLARAEGDEALAERLWQAGTDPFLVTGRALPTIRATFTVRGRRRDLTGLIRMLDFLSVAGEAECQPVGRRLLENTYHLSPSLAPELDRSFLQHQALIQLVRCPEPALSDLAPARHGSAQEATTVLAVLHPYTERTVVEHSYMDTLNELLRRSRGDRERELALALVEQHLLPEERRLSA